MAGPVRFIVGSDAGTPAGFPKGNAGPAKKRGKARHVLYGGMSGYSEALFGMSVHTIRC